MELPSITATRGAPTGRCSPLRGRPERTGRIHSGAVRKTRGRQRALQAPRCLDAGDHRQAGYARAWFMVMYYLADVREYCWNKKRAKAHDQSNCDNPLKDRHATVASPPSPRPRPPH